MSVVHFVNTCISNLTMLFTKFGVFVLVCFLFDAIDARECGKRNFNPTLVTGGQDAVRGEFPWHAAVYRRNGERFEYVCGGTLISNKTVITASSCVYNKDKETDQNSTLYQVALGKLYRDYNGDPDNSGVQFVDVDQIRISQNPQEAPINIAVLKLATPVNLTSTVNVAGAKLKLTHENSVFSNGSTIGTVAGWGVNNSFTGGPKKLQWMDLPWINHDTCLNKTSPQFLEYLKENKFWAGYENKSKGVWAGDVGSGYMVLKDDRYYLRGVALKGPNDYETVLCHSDRSSALTSFAHLDTRVSRAISYIVPGGARIKPARGAVTTTLVVGGSIAAANVYGYQLSLQINGQHICGASIISATWALTAAHCVKNKEKFDLKLRSGSVYTNKGGKLHTVKRRVIHPMFQKSRSVNLDYNIALLEVKEKFQYGKSTEAIRMPEQGVYAAVPQTGTKSIITGWGALKTNGTTSSTLMYAYMAILPDRSCKAYFQANSVTSRMICTWSETVELGVCQGDSGGPLNQDGFLIGVTSFTGDYCGESPSVFAKVSEFRTWINSIYTPDPKRG